MPNYRLPAEAYLFAALLWVVIGTPLGQLAYQALQHGSWKAIAVTVVSMALCICCLMGAHVCVKEFARRQR